MILKNLFLKVILSVHLYFLLILIAGCDDLNPKWVYGSWVINKHVSAEISGMSQKDVDAIIGSRVLISEEKIVVSKGGKKYECKFDKKVERQEMDIDDFISFDSHQGKSIPIEELGIDTKQKIIVCEMECNGVKDPEVIDDVIVLEKDKKLIFYSGLLEAFLGSSDKSTN
jgi:hypothetical protein